MPVLGAIDGLQAMDMEFQGRSVSGGVPMATKLQVVVVVQETSLASDTVDFEMQITSTEAQRDSTEKTTALAVATTAAVDLTNLFFLMHGDTDSDNEREGQRWGWTGGISVLFAFAALLSAAGLVLPIQTSVGVSATRRRVIEVASAAALFVASAGTVLSLLEAQGLL